MSNMPSAQQLMDELHELQACRRAVTDLVMPGTDLHSVDRDKFTTLLSVLDRDTERVLGDFERLLKRD